VSFLVLKIVGFDVIFKIFSIFNKSTAPARKREPPRLLEE
jgi:hypothetical protein